MNTSRFFASAAGIAMAAFAGIGTAGAQDVSLAPQYGTVELDAGFLPDPHSISMRSGGSIDASDVGSHCTGYIANAPDVRLQYSSGSSPLIISADSSSDTTLVINAPNGQWYCDDDSGEGVNPSVRFEKPMKGRYEIWVGTYGSSDFEPVTLDISELYSQ